MEIVRFLLIVKKKNELRLKMQKSINVKSVIISNYFKILFEQL